MKIKLQEIKEKTFEIDFDSLVNFILNENFEYLDRLQDPIEYSKAILKEFTNNLNYYFGDFLGVSFNSWEYFYRINSSEIDNIISEFKTYLNV